MSDTTITPADPVDANVARLMVDLLDSVADQSAFARLDDAGSVVETVTFAHLHELVGAVAGGLRERGIGRGNRVVVFVPMSIELYVTLLALLRIGAVATFIEPWGGRRMIEQAADLVEADAFIGIPKSFLLRALSPALRRAPLAFTTGDRRIPGARRFAELLATPASQHVVTTEAMSADEPALVTFTTGSTGTPKGANRTHSVLRAQHDALARQVPHAEHARVWTNLPVVVLHNLGRGAETILAPGSLSQQATPDPAHLHDVVRRSGATILAVSPAPLAQLASAPGRTPIDRVERVYTGGGPVTPRLLDAAGAMLPNAKLVALYGSTEAEPVAHASADEVLDRRDAMRRHGGIYVGHDVDDVELRLVDAELGGDVYDGAPGEVLVSGAHVNRDYWRNPQAVRENKVFAPDGRVWHRTGDIARRDPDGGLWLLGRRGQHWAGVDGTLHWALELETPIADLPAIARAAVCLPAGDDPGGRIVVAIEPTPGTDRDAAARAARTLLDAHLAAPDVDVRVLDAIPVDRRHGTKIDVPALRKRLARTSRVRRRR